MSGNLVPFPKDSQPLILDSWPIMEWFKDREPAASYFETTLERARTGKLQLILSTINLGEIYYSCWNWWDEARAEASLATIRALPIRIVHPTAEDAFLAARIKGHFKGAYGDAFAAVLALEFEAPILTGDPDFIRFRDGGLVDIDWIGK